VLVDLGPAAYNFTMEELMNRDQLVYRLAVQVGEGPKPPLLAMARPQGAAPVRQANPFMQPVNAQAAREQQAHLNALFPQYQAPWPQVLQRALAPAVAYQIQEKNNINDYTAREAAMASKHWKFDPGGLKNSTPEEETRYAEILKAIESFSNASKQGIRNALSTVRRFQKLHRHNAEICHEIYAEGINHSLKHYAERPLDIVLHPEKNDASLEQRAHIFFNILESAWLGTHHNPDLLRDFIENAFYSDAVCLEVQSAKIDEWMEKNKNLLETHDPIERIKKQSKAENILAHANILYGEIKATSDVGKKYLETMRDKDNELDYLHKLEQQNGVANAPQIEKTKKTLDYIGYALQALDDKFEHWMKASKKYIDMEKELLNHFVGKEAADGMITPEDIHTILTDTLCWPLED